MLKHYSANIKLTRNLETRVSSSNENEAREMITSRIGNDPNFRDLSIESVEILLEWDSYFEVGQLISHPYFSDGKILKLWQVTNPYKVLSDAATIEFQDGIRRDIVIGEVHGLEVID